MTSRQLTPTVMEMMEVIVMILTNQCAPMEPTAIGEVAVLNQEQILLTE